MSQTKTRHKHVKGLDFDKGQSKKRERKKVSIVNMEI